MSWKSLLNRLSAHSLMALGFITPQPYGAWFHQRWRRTSWEASVRALAWLTTQNATLVYGLGFRVQGLGFRVQGFRVQGLGFRVQGLGFRVQGLGFRASLEERRSCDQMRRERSEGSYKECIYTIYPPRVCQTAYHPESLPFRVVGYTLNSHSRI